MGPILRRVNPSGVGLTAPTEQSPNNPRSFCIVLGATWEEMDSTNGDSLLASHSGTVDACGKSFTRTTKCRTDPPASTKGDAKPQAWLKVVYALLWIAPTRRVKH
jgi:hypothetical protein